jgi:hypothetical protein
MDYFSFSVLYFLNFIFACYFGVVVLIIDSIVIIIMLSRWVDKGFKLGLQFLFSFNFISRATFCSD